jgi:lysophospholipase L1-like esterase
MGVVVLLILSAARCQAQPEPSAVSAGCAERAVQRQLDRAATLLSDWAGLGRYQEANARLPPPGSQESRVVFMGDSITDFWDDEGAGGFFPGRPYVNRGISGQTTSQMLVRFRPDVVALRPKAVVILAGTNDLAGNTGPIRLAAIEGNLASMAELAHAHDVRVVLASLLPVSDDHRDADGKPLVRTACRPPAQIQALNERIRRYAAEQRHVYLDYATALADARGMLKTELSEDGLHPNAKGYALMAPLAEKAIAQALAAKR